MAEQIWDDFARLNAGERFKAQSAEMGAAVTEAVVEAAQLDAAKTAARGAVVRVLDVACGSGEPSISIAERLGSTGQVIGIDMAGAPLEVARERACKRGLANVEYMQGDVHALPFADAHFDRVTSRLGVMFFADLPKALRELLRVLKPGGRVALLAWGKFEQPYFDSTIGTVRKLHPELEIPQNARLMLRFGGAPGALGKALSEAGFSMVEEQVRQLRWNWHGSPEEMWDYFRAITVPFRALLEKVQGDETVDRAVLDALGKRFDGEWVRFDAEMVLATAVKS
jgi:SAM-dependent methyltransferase